MILLFHWRIYAYNQKLQYCNREHAAASHAFEPDTFEDKVDSTHCKTGRVQHDVDAMLEWANA